jgi:phosphopantothenoylcysteine decarboxylase/phosphopantothenate--cysteine ligase
MLVTAGPTRDSRDTVRYPPNEAPGRPGYAIARAARRRGHDVTLITGPTALRPPVGIEIVHVTSAREMRRAVLGSFERTDCLVMAAAVADFRPKRPSTRKLKKEEVQDVIELVRNPDIVAEAARRKGRRVVIGFALETDDGLANAVGKLRRKRLDFVVWNGPEALGSDKATAVILGPQGPVKELQGRTKDAIGAAILRIAEEAVAQRAEGE